MAPEARPTYRLATAPRHRAKKTAAEVLIEQLAGENRRLLSDWRAVILLRHATEAIPAEERRWSSYPNDVADVHPILRSMEAQGKIRRYIDALAPRIYEITVPYAGKGLIDEAEVLMEIHPYSTLSHLSALAFHALTDQLPKDIIASIPASGTGGLLPLNTTNSDWAGMSPVRGRCIEQIMGRSVRWIRVSANRLFGSGIYRSHGYPVRVTTPERTLLDGLLDPDLSGGMDNVLKAWAAASDVLDLEELVSNVDRFRVSVLRQRVGYIMEELGLAHRELDTWQAQAKRGGSSKLLGSAPYVSTHSDRWNLSINAPISPLHGIVE